MMLFFIYFIFLSLWKCKFLLLLPSWFAYTDKQIFHLLDALISDDVKHIVGLDGFVPRLSSAYPKPMGRRVRTTSKHMWQNFCESVEKQGYFCTTRIRICIDVVLLGEMESTGSERTMLLIYCSLSCKTRLGTRPTF